MSPRTGFGQMLASVVMVMGYAIIAVPTGIVTAEMVHGKRSRYGGRRCGGCGLAGHDKDALHCKRCGGVLTREKGDI
jgi:voltage-gated potassium channel